MNRIRSMTLRRRSGLLAATVAIGLLLAGAGLAAAASGVGIVESGGQYHFQPGDINVTVGDSVTWTNNSDAPHTVTSDSGSALGGSVNPSNTYQVTFTQAGDVAYHCGIHPYMHGTVHVAALPPTDAAVTSGSTGVLIALAGVASLLILTAFGIRMRHVRA
jgi:plastocyanin